MPAYAVAHLTKMTVNRQLVAYLQQVDATLEPYGGRFLVHGKKSTVVEGDFSGYVIIIEFPDMEKAEGWYYSEDYQEIASLRKDNSEGSIILVEGVPDNYTASDLLRSKG